MSRKKTPEQLEQEAWEADLRSAQLAKKQAECDHYRAEPTHWYWSTGRVSEMECPECGATKSFEESDHD